jgi:uncharacterized protein (TIGR00255 family)
MPLRSMTGFARSDGVTGDCAWHWEVRTVNGRGLDIRLRLPPGLEALEPMAREACARKLVRGSCSLSLSIRREGSGAVIRINEKALADVAVALRRASELVEAAPARLDGILALRGVLDVVEPDEDESAAEARLAALRQGLETALDRVIEERTREGSRLATVLSAQVAEIAAITADAERSPARTPEAIRARLAEQVARLMGSEPRLDEARLHQEAMLLATKADIAEEIERLKSHVAAAREHLSAAEPVGRKLDFLAQELNREANTLCSKANVPELTRLGLALKAVIDQLREQVQNIE